MKSLYLNMTSASVIVSHCSSANKIRAGAHVGLMCRASRAAFIRETLSRSRQATCITETEKISNKFRCPFHVLEVNNTLKYIKKMVSGTTFVHVYVYCTCTRQSLKTVNVQ